MHSNFHDKSQSHNRDVIKVGRLSEDHKHARLIAEAVIRIGKGRWAEFPFYCLHYFYLVYLSILSLHLYSYFVLIDRLSRLTPRQVDTNIVIVRVEPAVATPAQVVSALAKVIVFRL